MTLYPYVEHGNKYVLEWQAARTPRKDIFYGIMSFIGAFDFYLVLFPFLFFMGCHRLARNLLYLMAWGIYIGNCGKDFCCLKRPHSPPVIRKDTLEYGMPSTHTVNAVNLGVFFFIDLVKEQHHILGTPFLVVVGICDVILVFFVLQSRIYKGMHCVADIVGGFFLAMLLVFSSQYGIVEMMDKHIFDPESTILLPIGLFLGSLFFIWLHPRPIDNCPCYIDSVAFLAAHTAVYCGMWFFVHLPFIDPALRTVSPNGDFLPFTIARGWKVAAVRVFISLLFVPVGRSVAKNLIKGLWKYIPWLRLSHVPPSPSSRKIIPTTTPKDFVLEEEKEEKIDFPGLHSVQGVEKYWTYFGVGFQQTFSAPLVLYFLGYL
jgi:sphingosine-1-phosphate phosphatase 1/sphingosine-1-phosphate phosphatase 2